MKKRRETGVSIAAKRANRLLHKSKTNRFCLHFIPLVPPLGSLEECWGKLLWCCPV